MPSDGNTAMQAGKDARAAGGHLAAGENAGPPGAPAGEMTPHDPGTEWDYAPAPESRDIVTLEPEYGLFLNGEFVPATGGQVFATVNPATEEPLAQVAEAGAADVDRGVAAARAAYEQVWGPMPGAERAKYLYRIARILQERSREFAVLESLDNGKPIKESRDVDVPLAAAHFFYHAGWADKLEHAGLGPSPRPVGVAGQVIPWNFPLLMAAWKLAPALAAGNTCVLKPAETTPLTALLLAEVCQQAGLPPGVVNVLTGAGETGAALVAHPGVDKVAFTTASSSTRATSAARAPGCWCRNRSRTLWSSGCATGSARSGSATRWTRTPTSARSTRGSSSTRSASCPTPARPRAPSAGPRPASCRNAGSGSRRRCSPGSASRTGSPGRRSSGRCCRCSRSAPRRRRSHLQPVRPREPVRRVPRVRLRAGGRQAWPGRVPQ